MNQQFSQKQTAQELQEYLSKVEEVAHLRPCSDERSFVEPEQITIFDLLDDEANNETI